MTEKLAAINNSPCKAHTPPPPMHGVAHVLTGWLIGCWWGFNPLENCLLAVLAVTLDADGEKITIIEHAIGCLTVNHGIDGCAFNHAIFTHTLVWCVVVVVSVALGFYAWKQCISLVATTVPKTGYMKAIALAVLSHLALDTWTYNASCGDTHQYLWPLSNFSFHLNCIFGTGDTTELLRSLGEWAVYHPLMWFLICQQIVRTAMDREARSDPVQGQVSWRMDWRRVYAVVVFGVAPVVYSLDPFGDGALCIPWLLWLFNEGNGEYATVSVVPPVVAMKTSKDFIL